MGLKSLAILVLAGFTAFSMFTVVADEPTETRPSLPSYILLNFSENLPSPVVSHGKFTSRDVFEESFRSNYPIFGQRLSPPDTSEIVGALLVFNNRTTVALPIHSWSDANSTIFLCQGTSTDGIAPEYSARHTNMLKLFEKIIADLGAE